MKGSISRALVPWATGLVVVGLIGLLLANQWYAADICPVDEWKCGLGDFGRNAAFYALPLGAIVAVVAFIAWCIDAMSRRR